MLFLHATLCNIKKMDLHIIYLSLSYSVSLIMETLCKQGGKLLKTICVYMIVIVVQFKSKLEGIKMS